MHTLSVKMHTIPIVTVTITHSGLNTAGEDYTLECSMNGTNDSAIFQWLDELGTPLINDGSRKIVNSTSSSYLQFIPLQQSHEEAYTCNATIASVTESKSAKLSVNGTCHS